MKAEACSSLTENAPWIIVVLLAFGAVYAFSLTFVYIEGDDAASVAYHALGRDSTVQVPYKPYHCGLDALLSLLPANEPVLRVVAMTVSGVATVFAFMLMMALVLDWLAPITAGLKATVAAILLLSVPEYFFLGLVYLPTMIGLCMVLLAHHVLRRAGFGPFAWSFRGDAGGLALIFLSAILFAVGGWFRWDLLLYGWVVVLDFVCGLDRWRGSQREVTKRLFRMGVWGCLSAAAWLGLVISTGTSLPQIIDSMSSEAALAAASGPGAVVQVGSYVSLLTPSLVVLALVGFYRLRREARPRAVFVFAAVLPAVFFALHNPPKKVIVFLPPLLFCAAAGIRLLLRPPRAARRVAVISVLAALPWILGIRATYDDTAWGPGFELQEFDRKTGSTSLRPGLWEGAAIPTSEGQRPLYGYGGVLLGGGWRRVAQAMAADREKAAQAAVNRGLPIVCLQEGCRYFEAELPGQGYLTTDPCSRITGEEHLGRREFRNNAGKTLELIELTKASFSEYLIDANSTRRLTEALGSGKTVAYSASPSAMRLLYLRAPSVLQKVGTTVAVVDWGALARLQPVGDADTSTTSAE